MIRAGDPHCPELWVPHWPPLSEWERTKNQTITYAYDNLYISGSVINPFRYTGREFDAETGLYYYRARYYDPATGRFISEDPIGYAGVQTFTPMSRMVRLISETLLDSIVSTSSCTILPNL
jgi:RHS repeat-associated protein